MDTYLFCCAKLDLDSANCYNDKKSLRKTQIKKAQVKKNANIRKTKVIYAKKNK